MDSHGNDDGNDNNQPNNNSNSNNKQKQQRLTKTQAADVAVKTTLENARVRLLGLQRFGVWLRGSLEHNESASFLCMIWTGMLEIQTWESQNPLHSIPVCFFCPRQQSNYSMNKVFGQYRVVM
jgi:hypothetical protein